LKTISEANITIYDNIIIFPSSNAVDAVDNDEEDEVGVELNLENQDNKDAFCLYLFENN